MKPEARVSNQIRNDLKTWGFAVWSLEQGYRRERGGTRQTPGLGDLYAIGHGTSLWVEVKAPGKEKNLSDAQRIFERECRDHGINHVVASDSTTVFDHLVELGIFEVVA